MKILAPSDGGFFFVLHQPALLGQRVGHQMVQRAHKLDALGALSARCGQQDLFFQLVRELDHVEIVTVQAGRIDLRVGLLALAVEEYLLDVLLVHGILLGVTCGLSIMQRMTLTEYFKTDVRGAKAEMASHLKITPTWMSLLIAGRRKASPVLALAIEEATGGLVTKQELRPDIFR